MSSGSRAALCKCLGPSLASTALNRFKSFRPRTSFSSASTRLFRMATDPPPQPPSASGSGEASSAPASSAIDFLSLCHRLKTTKRAGWMRKDIQSPESIADHMYRTGLMALIASDIPGVDRDKCIKMAIVHDIAEAIVGDITPSDGVPKHEKSRLEQEALDYMCKLLGGGERAKEIGQLWMEYEENLSLEAKFVKDLDKVEMILQALEYETEQGKNLEEFFQSTAAYTMEKGTLQNFTSK
ncbi:uncharacterized protein LOC127805742 isoform X2 [Diospyros lotus]|uniref:uncharacterized protein LOC127805742 isoform X2 n=1 Tax=Diospyros lotus TaxID=55363 RepID=UPI002255C9CE|nr:uncharacterized protein LOC127805742 isoform X2 [Diospyros lotus]